MCSCCHLLCVLCALAAICFISYMLFIPPSIYLMCPCHNSLYIEYVLATTYSIFCPCCHLLYITFALLPSTIYILFVLTVTYPISYLFLLLPTQYLICPCCHLSISHLPLLPFTIYLICPCCYLTYITFVLVATYSISYAVAPFSIYLLPFCGLGVSCAEGSVCLVRGGVCGQESECLQLRF